MTLLQATILFNFFIWSILLDFCLWWALLLEHTCQSVFAFSPFLLPSFQTPLFFWDHTASLPHEISEWKGWFRPFFYGNEQVGLGWTLVFCCCCCCWRHQQKLLRHLALDRPCPDVCALLFSPRGCGESCSDSQMCSERSSREKAGPGHHPKVPEVLCPWTLVEQAVSMHMEEEGAFPTTPWGLCLIYYWWDLYAEHVRSLLSLAFCSPRAFNSKLSIPAECCLLWERRAVCANTLFISMKVRCKKN